MKVINLRANWKGIFYLEQYKHGVVKLEHADQKTRNKKANTICSH